MRSCLALRLPSVLLCMLAASAHAGSADKPSNPRRTPVVEVFEKAHGAVVNISSTKIVQINRGRSPLDWLFEDFEDLLRPGTRKYKTTSIGSGFVIHDSGYLVTNAHVVDRATDVQITFDDHSAYEGIVVAEDRQNDLALLKIKPKNALPVIRMGDSGDLMIGETVIAIGNPLGFQHTLTTGVISATDRNLELMNEKTGRPLVYADLIQTDASINPGNSGGPLLNVLGELIGINTAIRSDAQNIGFAIPVNTLKRFLPMMIHQEQKSLFSLGLDINPRRRITGIVSDSPAERAGLRVGDTITRVDGKTVVSDFEFYIAMLGHRPGEAVLLDAERSGLSRTARVLLQERPRPDGKQLALEKLGIELEELTPAKAHRLGLRTNRGLLITAVERGGPAHREGIAGGDILTRLGGFAVSGLDFVGQLLDDAEEGIQTQIRILRMEDGVFYRYYTYVTLR